jgi:hypothetical protein
MMMGADLLTCTTKMENRMVSSLYQAKKDETINGQVDRMELIENQCLWKQCKIKRGC